ncbi:DUF885 domain-containing protein [Sphingobacterium thalpophilum]|uniref:DUF885 domain-containing protein n=1 Tax=Sphingobacterium thalpophilum TaxID=259 RepID=UPI002D76DE20|nr:DUF885 domain-containing protein [Sphingobacterium thalpophilum]
MKLTTLILFILGLVFLASCGAGSNKKQAQADTVANAEFKAYEDRFIEQLWRENPEWATQVGFHRYDSLLTIPDARSREQRLAFSKRHLDSLSSFDLNDLNLSQQTDYHLMQNYLESTVWAIEKERSHEWNPSSYNVSGTIAFMLAENYAPLDQRLRAIHQRIVQIPAYYRAAQQQIKAPAQELTDLAIQQNLGGLSVFEADLRDSLQKSNLSATEKSNLQTAADSAMNAIRGFVTFLKETPNPAPRSFRLGQELYEQKFKFDIQSGSTAAQIYDAAVARKSYLHTEMYKISKELWPKYFGPAAQPTDSLVLIRKMIDTLSVNHVKAEDFQAAIEAQIPKLVEFVKKKDLLYIDDSKPLIVRKEPAYMAGVAGASISAPGPYDKGGNTYYNVGSLNGWTKAASESYLREYNHYILQILNIHEAIPGHYTQLVYANQSPSLIKSVLGNGAMIEGWAVYTEQMMLENGYGDRAPEMWLMWYKWHLRTVCNAILDYSVHVKNMSEKEAMHLLVDEAFQQQAEAAGKWKRVSVSSVQLTSYFTGYKEIYDLREAVKKEEGAQFNLKAFNEKFLSFGNSPVKYIREMMLAK